MPIRFERLSACVQDSKAAVTDRDPGPPDPTDYEDLMARLEKAKGRLPPLYEREFYVPLLGVARSLGRARFRRLLGGDPGREGAAGAFLDACQAVLQNAEDYESEATDAFQEVISDLYDGFLSEEDRRGVSPPDLTATPPLVKWGRPDFGPYTFTAEAYQGILGFPASVVSLPPANARRGLLAWAALGHETAGHDVLSADRGLRAELAASVGSALLSQSTPGLARYWRARIDETASDVLGVLNMGPAAAIALVGYFRAIRGVTSGVEKLSSQGPAGDPHPADILRGYLGAEVVAGLEFTGASAWAAAIRAEIDRDLAPVVLNGEPVDALQARRSAEIVARTLRDRPARALEGTALGQIQNWRDDDQRKVDELRAQLRRSGRVVSGGKGFYAAHAVAAGVEEALSGSVSLERVFQRMLQLLRAMHGANPAWGPLFVRHRGSVSARRLTGFGSGL